MAIDTQNEIITAPVYMTDVDTVLDDGNVACSVYRACLSPNINKWSRYKPIFVTNEMTGINFHFRDYVTQHGWDSRLSGLKTNSYPSFSNLATKIDVTTGVPDLMRDWDYMQEKVAEDEAPKRLGDFDGYFHKAQPPFAGFAIPTELGTLTSGTLQQAVLVDALQTDTGTLDPTAPGSILLSQLKAPTMPGKADITLDKMFFGVVLITSNGTQECKWAKSENVTINLDTTYPSTHVWSVDMSLSDVAAGTYWAVPVLTRKKIASHSTTPEQVCLVPNCKPIKVKVTSGTTNVGDVKAFWTSNRVSFPSNGSASATSTAVVGARVVSSASYDTRCDYTFYTTSGTDTAQKNKKTGSFTLNSKASRSLLFVFDVTKENASSTHMVLKVEWGDANSVKRTTEITTDLLAVDSLT